MNITLRNFKAEDFDTLYEIDQACYEPEVAYSQRELRAYLRFSGSDCLVAPKPTRNTNRRFLHQRPPRRKRLHRHH